MEKIFLKKINSFLNKVKIILEWIIDPSVSEER